MGFASVNWEQLAQNTSCWLALVNTKWTFWDRKTEFIDRWIIINHFKKDPEFPYATCFLCNGLCNAKAGHCAIIWFLAKMIRNEYLYSF
jgi:hypothetical protein